MACLTSDAVHTKLLHRLFRNLEEVEKLSELGVLFLLFEMGLELSIDRLRVGASSVSYFVAWFLVMLLLSERGPELSIDRLRVRFSGGHTHVHTAAVIAAVRPAGPTAQRRLPQD